ncbi:bifunctional DNA-formamidopyrimidine glycosylase/DNA-(apurinic or apyrimidinic site) lyase [Enterobacteriaceae endosymbiont of Donacia bicoloricornis]|uniref:bifunctional DNA-formamidopyrimidine glycosylase/DNA-(apurinic or apyrimidinic site) lyase n=1 Tax=Enterobacteriaceae endosymbiont of Donacia bicoloricornis TaxID=2675772 RepID=UPI001448E660|nr:bifunctional DNA-formamidopyrimidine glycosylase/DNA-(apurinic or apyrimidinic site) lyase [Enterobacteriaceae endosymbiont of Donacia bicoloricornis]QJC37922.1 bifunctional DNA-formamidopyrimidine glycosylase/DNA-(apurinic or apyrimidinic site) lyase [Enterobacteriaceae endosymbiont of Donacia bicoloricornis]
MPELPEVEVIKNMIKPFLKGKIINYSIVRTKKLKYIIPINIFKIKNKKILDIKRRGRYIIIILLKNTIIIHLGMTGILSIINNKNNIFYDKHDHIDLIINNNFILRYTDIRKFGFWIWETKDYKKNIFLKKLGPEPLKNKFNNLYLYEFTKKKNIYIKTLIMDNKIVTGIGNIYANESLFLSKISPFRISHTLNLKEITILVKNIKYILYKSIKYGGSTINNYKLPNNNIGNFTQYFFVYGRKNKLCKICKEQIISKTQRNRSTFFCYKCQK